MLATAVFLPWYGPGRGAIAAHPAPLQPVSAIHAIAGMSIALLVLAFLALTDALLPLVRHVRVPAGAGASLGLLGVIAAALVAFRMVEVPAPVAGAAAASLRGGAWLALAGAVAIAAGGCWPRASHGRYAESNPFKPIGILQESRGKRLSSTSPRRRLLRKERG
jgi:hypothetical protein